MIIKLTIAVLAGVSALNLVVATSNHDMTGAALGAAGITVVVFNFVRRWP